VLRRPGLTKGFWANNDDDDDDDDDDAKAIENVTEPHFPT